MCKKCLWLRVYCECCFANSLMILDNLRTTTTTMMIYFRTVNSTCDVIYCFYCVPCCCHCPALRTVHLDVKVEIANIEVATTHSTVVAIQHCCLLLLLWLLLAFLLFFHPVKVHILASHLSTQSRLSCYQLSFGRGFRSTQPGPKTKTNRKHKYSDKANFSLREIFRQLDKVSPDQTRAPVPNLPICKKYYDWQ